MASIQQRGNRYCVVYSYDTPDGQHEQKWETFLTQADAKRRKAEIEYKQELASFVVPQCKSMDELLTSTSTSMARSPGRSSCTETRRH